MGVTSTPGKGSSFWFTLPIRSSATRINRTPSINALTSPGMQQPPEELNILCIEDIELNQEIVKRMLLKAGISNVSFAYDGLSGLSALHNESHGFNLILLDINLPDMDGFEFNRRKEALGLAKGIPVIAITASTSQETRQMAKEFGIAGFVTKPLKFDHLVGTISEHTRHH